MTDLPWLIGLVGEYTEIKTGKVDANAAKADGEFPFFTCAREISRIDVAPFEGKVVLIAGNGDLNVKYYEGRFNAYQRTYFLKSKDDSKVMPKFLFWVMDRYLEELRKLAIGTTVKYIKLGNLTDAPLPLPPLAEQERIVEILEEQFSRLDSALASVKAVREKSKAFRRSLLHSAFNGELTGGTEGWREVALGEVAETQLGKMLNSKKQTGTAVMPYLRNINLRWGGFDLTDVKQMDIFPNEVEQFTLRNGDLLICEGGEPGRCAVWNRDGEMAFQNAMHRVRPHAELSPQFLALQFEAKVRNGELEHLFSGVTIKHFSQSKLRAVEVPLPPIAAQERIVSVLEEQFSKLDKALEVANQLEERIASERRSLLHAAFTGELTSQWRKTHV